MDKNKGGDPLIYLFFDTETTGVIRKDLPADHDDQPRIVQLGMELCDGDRVASSVKILIDPGCEVPESATKVHGIATSEARSMGVPSIVAVALFNNLAKKAETLVAHNAAFDVGVLTGEYLRLNRESPFGEKKICCTMALSTDVCRLPGKYKDFKWPSLKEAYEILVDPAGFDGSHDAMADVRACRAVFVALKKRGLV